MLEISTLSHLFSSKIDEQSHQIEQLHESAEQDRYTSLEQRATAACALAAWLLRPR